MITGLAIILALALYGGCARRYMGGWKPIPYERGLSVALLVAPLAAAPSLAAWPLGDWPWVAAGGAAILAAGLATSLGDGDATDLGGWDQPEPDKPSWDWLAGRSDNTRPEAVRRARDMRALAVSGLAVTIVPGAMVIALGHPVIGAALALSGALKVPAYVVGYMLPLRLKELTRGREAGEAVWGAALCGSAAASALAVF